MAQSWGLTFVVTRVCGLVPVFTAAMVVPMKWVRSNMAEELVVIRFVDFAIDCMKGFSICYFHGVAVDCGGRELVQLPVCGKN